MLGERIGVLVAAGGAGWEVGALRALSGAAGSVLLKRCVDLPDLLATASTGQARVAVVADGLVGLDADSLALLGRAGLGVVLVADGEPSSLSVLPGVVAVTPGEEMSSLPGAVRAADERRDDGARPASPAAVRSESGPAGSALRVAAGARADRGVPTPDGQHPGAGAGSVGAPGTGDGGDGGPAGTDEAGCDELARPPGEVVAVWGPTGAPGRTTVAVGVAAELGRRGHDVLLVDADGYGGAVAQHLGMLEEVSGLLSAVRLANAGRLDPAGLASLARQVGPGFRVLTGLPRADRWAEVREAAFDALLETARELCSYVVLDLGFSVEEADPAYGSGVPQRNLMTLAGLDRADEVLVVGAADPVGLARLARGLVELPEVVPLATTRVVVNRMRPSLGWGEREVRAMVEGFMAPAGLHVLPDDRAAADRALVSGQPVTEVGDSALRRAFHALVDSLDGAAQGNRAESSARRPRRGLRRRRAGRGR